MRVTKVIGFQSFVSSAIAAAVSCSSNLLTDSQGNRANAAWLSCLATTGAVRYRDDGTAPTVSTGLRIPSGVNPFLYQGDLGKLQFIAESPGNPTLSVCYVQVAD
ncbi:MAG: hypothetical protein Q8P46_13895 [Hyphomicrobiales bacterium]|nr:hypothetical protein [Hyphomicrobiales bacterium]